MILAARARFLSEDETYADAGSSPLPRPPVDSSASVRSTAFKGEVPAASNAKVDGMPCLKSGNGREGGATSSGVESDSASERGVLDVGSEGSGLDSGSETGLDSCCCCFVTLLDSSKGFENPGFLCKRC